MRSSFTKIPLLPIALLILLTGVATSFVKHTSAQTIAQARVHAPELTGGRGWLNTDKPLTLAALRGKIVLLDFWTYGCINCILCRVLSDDGVSSCNRVLYCNYSNKTSIRIGVNTGWSGRVVCRVESIGITII